MTGEWVEVTAPAGKYSVISAGSGHACAITTGGDVVCWGGDYGRGDALAGEFSAISVGSGFFGSGSCALTTGGEAVCWDYDYFDSVTFERVEVTAPAGKFSAIAAGSNHACAITTGGDVVCWGNNSAGQADPPTGKFSAIAAGSNHACAIAIGGDVVCWGGRWDWEAEEWVDVTAPEGKFVDISAGVGQLGGHWCAVRVNGEAVCWGDNYDGQADAPAGRFGAISAGSYHSCAITTGGEVVCWGPIPTPDGVTWVSEPPTATVGAEPSTELTAVSVGAVHACGITTDGDAVCWGSNRDGQADAPGGKFVDISASLQHTCGVRADGTGVCWGENTWYPMPDVPTEVEFRSISAGGLPTYACGITIADEAICWGPGHPYGEGYYDGVLDAPAGEFLSVSAGSRSGCGITTSNDAVCWGLEERYDGERTERVRREWVFDGKFRSIAIDSDGSMCSINLDGILACLNSPTGEFTSVSRGESEWGDYACGIRVDGTAVCWGDAGYGQTDAPEGEFKSISVGGLHACGIRVDGTTVCWGLRVASGGAYSYDENRLFSVYTNIGERSLQCGFRIDGRPVCRDNEAAATPLYIDWIYWKPPEDWVPDSYGPWSEDGY